MWHKKVEIRQGQRSKRRATVKRKGEHPSRGNRWHKALCPVAHLSNKVSEPGNEDQEKPPER